MYRWFQVSEQVLGQLRGASRAAPFFRRGFNLPVVDGKAVKPPLLRGSHLPARPQQTPLPFKRLIYPQVRQPFTTFPRRGLHTEGRRATSWAWLLKYIETLTTGTVLVLSSYALYKMISVQHETREEPIIASPIEIDNPAYEQNEDTSSSHGSLSNQVIGYQGKTFLKKGAKNRDSLIREFVVADALHDMYPETQPQSLILHEKLDNERAQFFTLSEMRPGSMDFEDFIKGGWEEKLIDKPLFGFERTLAMVGVIAGQQDCKFANMIIVDKGTHYEAALIDHELSGMRFFLGLNRRTVTDNFARLTSIIRDLHNPDDEQFGGKFKFGLTNDPRGKAFINYVKDHSMDRDQLNAFYLKLASQDFSQTIERLTQLSTLSSLVTEDDVSFWQKELDTWKALAKDYCVENALSNDGEDEPSPSP